MADGNARPSAQNQQYERHLPQPLIWGSLTSCMTWPSAMLLLRTWYVHYLRDMQVIKAAYSSGFLCFDNGSIYGVCAICMGFGRLIPRRRYKDLISGVEKVVISGFNLSSDPSTSTADTLLGIWHSKKPPSTCSSSFSSLQLWVSVQELWLPLHRFLIALIRGLIIGMAVAPASRYVFDVCSTVYGKPDVSCYWLGLKCHSASDCYASEDCLKLALGVSGLCQSRLLLRNLTWYMQSTDNIHCGQDSYPTACWAVSQIFLVAFFLSIFCSLIVAVECKKHCSDVSL